MYCLSFDIAKGKSVVGLFNGQLEPLIVPYEIHHVKEEFVALASKLDISQTEIILESTSMYHYPIVSFFKNLGFVVIILNPIISREHKRNLRKTKTDLIDCVNLAAIYFEKKFNLQKEHLPIYHQMQSISRHVFTLNESMVRYKNRYHQLLELIFPLYEYTLKNEVKFKSDHMALLKAFPHPELLIHARVDRLSTVLASMHKRMDRRFLKTAQKIKDLAKMTLYSVSQDDVVVDEFVELSNLILDLDDKIMHHQNQLIDLAETRPDFHKIVSIFGISPYMAALLVAELKDLSSYRTVKQLTAACGLDPTIVQSGKSIDYRGHISKRGNKHARKALFNTVSTIIRSSSRLDPQNPILVYYRKKRSENKHHYASVIACTTKLLRIIFTLCKNDLTYLSHYNQNLLVTPIV
jgi:transposase